MKVLKMILIMITTLFVAVVTLFLEETTVIDSVAIGLFTAMESFLLIDLRGLIKGTRAKPAGGYDSMHLYRYITVMIIMALMGIITIYMYKVNEVNSVIAMTLYCTGVPVTMGLIIGGLQENRNSQKVGPE